MKELFKHLYPEKKGWSHVILSLIHNLIKICVDRIKDVLSRLTISPWYYLPWYLLDWMKSIFLELSTQ